MNPMRLDGLGCPAKRLAVRALSLPTGVLVWMYSSLGFAAGAEPPTKIINVADTRHMAPGLSRWIADVYNDNLLIFGLLVVVVMVIMGASLGFVFDRLIAMIGIDLGKLDHSE